MTMLPGIHGRPTEPIPPLMLVVDRGPLLGESRGWWDRLECGHLRMYLGVRHAQRRCHECPPGDSLEQGTLWGEATAPDTGGDTP